MKKKISMSALVKALKNDCLFKDAKVIEKTTNSIKMVYYSAIIRMSIIGVNQEYVSWECDGHISYLIAEELVIITEELEGSVRRYR